MKKLVQGPSINHVDRFLGIFDPFPLSWSLLLNKIYVVKWSFGKTPAPPPLSTCFMDAPIDMTLPIQTKVGTPPEEEDWMIPPPQQPVVMPPKNNIRRDSDQKR